MKYKLISDFMDVMLLVIIIITFQIATNHIEPRHLYKKGECILCGKLEEENDDNN